MDQNYKNYKTLLCRHFQTKGYCSLYNNCLFAHGQEQLRKKIDPVPEHLPPRFKPVSIQKTQLCKYYMNGYCRNHLTCKFAHGEKDIRGMTVQIIDQYKIDYHQAGEFLFSILRNLEQVFPENSQVTLKIKRGQEKVKQGYLHQGNQIITEIVEDINLTQKQKQQCQTILSNAYILHKININPI